MRRFPPSPRRPRVPVLALRAFRHAALALTLVAAYGVGSGEARAQSVEGTVVSAVTGDPIPGATVVAADSASGAVQRAETDAQGAFTLQFDAGAVVAVASQAPGFEASPLERLRLDGPVMVVTFELTPAEATDPPAPPPGSDSPPVDDRDAAPGRVVISGRVREQGTARPVAAALVTLVREGSGELVSATTAADGSFRMIPEFQDGLVSVGVSALGYRAPPPRRVVLDHEPLYLSLHLQADALELPSLDVTVTAREPRLERFGVLDRAARGFGDVVHGEELARAVRSAGGRTSLILTRVAGVRLSGANLEPTFIRSQGMSLAGGGCRPVIWVDGMIMQRMGQRFDDVVPPPDMISAVEVYPNPTTIPGEYRLPLNSCGAILIWTKG